MKQMKKYLAIFAVLFTVILSSCSNDDIPVQNATVIRVNPATVMSNFTYQLNAGDLDGVSTDQQLRIRLFIYDESGNLYTKEEQNVRNYLTTASFEIRLDNGKAYNAIAITDVTSSKTGAVAEYWEVSEENSLSSLKVSYLGGESNYGDQEVLGIASASVYSGDNTTINVEAAGALICTWAQNVHAYSNIQYIWVWGNRGNGYYDFSSTGALVSNPNLEVLPDFIDLNVDDFNYGVYSYKFMMPQTNYKLTLCFADANGDAIHVADRTGINMEKGHEYLYLVVLDPNDDGSGTYSTSFDDVTGKTSRSEQPDATELEFTPSSKHSNADNAPRKSWKIKELL